MKLLTVLLLYLFLASPVYGATFEAKYNTTQWLPVVVLDSTDESPETAVVYTAVALWYKEGRTGTWTQQTLGATSCTATAGYWCEEDGTNVPGSYRVYVANTVLDTKGDFYYIVKGTGFKTYWGWLKVKTETGDEESDTLAAILTDTSTTLDGYIDTEIAAIKAKTDSLTFTVANQVDSNVLGISGDSTAADDLEKMLDGTVGANLTLDSITVTATATNASAVTLTGDGTGSGLKVIAGATGNGMRVEGGSTSGNALSLVATGGGDGLSATGFGSGIGINAQGGSSGDGIKAVGFGGGVDFNATLDLDDLSGTLDAAEIGAGALTSEKFEKTAGFGYCDVTASTDTDTFQVGSCNDWQGSAVSMISKKFEQWGMVAYTNGGSTCNVALEGILVDSTTLNGANLDVEVASDFEGKGKWTAAPSATNCGVLIVK